MKLAIFDVCDTLYSTNTTFDFLDTYFMKDKKYILFRKSSKFFPIKVFNFIIYKTFKLDVIRILATSFLANKSILEIEIFTNDYVNNKLVSKQNKKIVELLKDYQSQGYKIVLMSGAYDFIIKDIARFFNIDTYFATKLEIVYEKFTGKISQDILLQKDILYKESFPNVSELIVVSDNKSDLNLLLLADKALAVCNKEKDLDFWKNYKNINIIRCQNNA